MWAQDRKTKGTEQEPRPISDKVSLFLVQVDLGRESSGNPERDLKITKRISDQIAREEPNPGYLVN